MNRWASEWPRLATFYHQVPNRETPNSMPHIAIPEGLPGIRGPLSLRPEVAKPLGAMMEVLMRDNNSLSRGERELIATYVSYLNNCLFCELAHGAVAMHYMKCDLDFVNQVKADFNGSDLTDKL